MPTLNLGKVKGDAGPQGIQGEPGIAGPPGAPGVNGSDAQVTKANVISALEFTPQPAGNYATLIGGKVPADQLPSYVDDVIESANIASLPTVGEGGKIYVTLDTNKTYRWSGSSYVEISGPPSSTDAIPEGSSNLYHTHARASAAAPVQSVAGKTGAVLLVPSDVGALGLRTYHALSVTPPNNTGELVLPNETNIEVALNSNAAPSGTATVRFPANVPNGSQVKIVLGSWSAFNEFRFLTSTGTTILSDNYTNPQGTFAGRIYYFQRQSGAWVNITSHSLPKANWTASSGAIDEILNKPSTFNPSAHTHVVDDVSNLRTSLEVRTGKTIFVDPALGTDTRGSVSKYSLAIPFATIAAAVSSSSIGDTVRVRAGNYTVADTIALADKGAVHFEAGAEVTFTGAGKYLFTLTANESKSISGYAVFILGSGTAGFFQTSGGTNTVQLVNIECGGIQAHATVVNVFDLYTGVVVLKATTIQALGAKVAIVQGTSTNFNYDVKFTYCSQLLDMPVSNSNSQFSCVAWTVVCYGAYGLRIVGGTTSLELKTLSMQGAGTPVAFEFANNDNTTNAHGFHGGRIFSGSTAPCISFATSTATQKFVKLKGDVQLLTGGPACITSGSARQVGVSSAHSNVAVGANVTVVGTLTVNAAFIY